MPRYFIHMVGEGNFRDEDGSELPDLSSAIAMAEKAARELIAEDVVSGAPIELDRQLQIWDEQGVQRASIAFRDVIQFRP